MIDIATMMVSVLGQEAFKRLLKSFQGNKTQLQRAYDRAFENTVRWYEKKYGDTYGSKNKRFFDYEPTERELAKLLLLRPKPDLKLISQIKLEEGKTTPAKVVREFVDKLRQEMGQIRECEELLVEREKFLELKKIADHTAPIPEYLPGIASDLHEMKEALVAPKKEAVKTSAKPLDWQQLYQAFIRRQLDKVPIKHVGGGLMGPELLELSEVFFEQDAGRRRIELAKLDRRIFKSAEGLKQLLEQADIWQAHIWRFAQEHRDMGTRISVFDEKSDVELTETEGKHHEQTVMRLVFDEKSDVELTEKVLDAFIAAIGQESRPLDAVQFQNKIDTLARKLKMSPDKILAVLRVLFETTIKREPVLTLLKAPCSALLIGDAGVGKTTVMRMLTLNLFKQLEKDGTKTTPIPLFVRLDKIAEYMKEDQPLDQAQEALLTYICQHWKPDLSCKDDLTEPAIESCSQPIQLILDGLDEIPSAKLRLKLASVARNLVQSQPVPSQPRQVRGQSGLAHIIITSRPAAVNESLIRTLGFPEVRLLELTTKQIEQFVHNFLYIYHAKDRQAGTKDARAFLSALEVSEAAQEFAANPLYLTVMILMHKKHQVLPKRRIELYAEFYEMLLLQRATGPALGKLAEKPVFEVPLPKEKPLTWGEDVYTPLLQRIAFITHSDDQDSVSISAERVVEAIEQQELQEEIKGIGIQDLARRFLDFADEHLGVLISRGPFYGFSHRSLQEYLAARRLSEFGESQQVKEFWTERALKKPDRWLEVARLLFCEIRKRDYLFKYLDGQWPRDIADTKDPRVIAMIGAILFDLEEFFKGGGGIRTLHQSVARALANRRDNSHHQPQLFLACGDALGLMDEPLIDVADPPMVYFEPKKPFNMGSEEYDNERPIHPVKLSPYWLGKYPVTNKEFAEFIKSGGYENEAYWYDEDSQWGFDAREFLRKELKEKAPRWWLDERFGKSRPLAPVVGVSWYEAMAYCRWWTLTYGEQWAEGQKLNRKVLMRLPTEAEWEFAARGYEGRKYPWGHTPKPSPELANYTDSKLHQTSTVGSYPKGATPEGILDLAGNVWEWCYDWYDEKYYEQCLAETKRTGEAVLNPTGISKEGLRVLRGGSWNFGSFVLRGTNRVRGVPGGRLNYVGFRCARAYL